MFFTVILKVKYIAQNKRSSVGLPATMNEILAVGKDQSVKRQMLPPVGETVTTAFNAVVDLISYDLWL